jgi:CRP-like cAMP-binding protein
VLETALLSTLPAGATIVRAGERIQQALVLVEGDVDEIVGGLVVTHSEPGTLLVAEDTVAGRSSSATLRARSRATFVSVQLTDLRRVGGEPEVAWWLASQSEEHRCRIDRVAVSSLRSDTPHVGCGQ